ncbi:hypothetical protein IIC68_04185 [archaeon]|nr:hypothetical protein [archaeon]
MEHNFMRGQASIEFLLTILIGVLFITTIVIPNVESAGDRVTDVKTGINANGTGILVPFPNKPNEKEKVLKLNSRNKYIAKDFLDAVMFIKKKSV